MAAAENSIERRSNLLAAALRDRVDSVYHALTEPVPAFRVAKPEALQVREFIALRDSGQLPTLRNSMGGPYDDDQVDRYVEHMNRVVPKYTEQIYNLPPAEDAI